jgi:arylsulfatase A-like enzyme
MRAYYAALTFMDTQLGLVLDEMDRLALWDNTIVVLFGDNGYALGERDNFFSKWPPYESATAVPLIVAAPGARLNGRPTERVAELLDIYPSLVDYCGLPRPDGPVGRSFIPLLSDPHARWTDHGITEYDDANKNGIRGTRYRYTESADGEPLMLYDLQADPFEHKNLMDDPAREPDIRRLSALMRSVLERSRKGLPPLP